MDANLKKFSSTRQYCKCGLLANIKQNIDAQPSTSAESRYALRYNDYGSVDGDRLELEQVLAALDRNHFIAPQQNTIGRASFSRARISAPSAVKCSVTDVNTESGSSRAAGNRTAGVAIDNGRSHLNGKVPTPADEPHKKIDTSHCQIRLPHSKPLQQIGPTCAFAAALMAINCLCEIDQNRAAEIVPTTSNVAVDADRSSDAANSAMLLSVVQGAIDQGISSCGEMFSSRALQEYLQSALFIQEASNPVSALQQQSFNWVASGVPAVADGDSPRSAIDDQFRVESSIVHGVNHGDLYDKIFHCLRKRRSIVLLAYDRDNDFSPCQQRGLQAHWACLLGFITLNCLDADRGQSDVTKTLVFARHGKSKRLNVWRLTDLVASNLQLETVNNERFVELYGKKPTLPQESVRAGLSGVFVELYKRISGQCKNS